MKQKKTVAKEPVRLRQRQMPSGNTSLYLDIYQNGERRYEYLHLYLVPEVGRDERAKNRETLLLADSVRAKRVVEIRNGEFGFNDAQKLDTLLLDYFRSVMRTRQITDATRATWDKTLRMLSMYCPNNTTFRQVTPKFVQGFRDFLDSRTLAIGTKGVYFSKFVACLRQAMKDELIVKDPSLNVERYHKQESRRVFLTFDELRQLAATPFKQTELRRAFLFSCLTGLRKSDILALRWGDVSQQGAFTRISFRQQKTGAQEYIDLTPQAVGYMGTPGAPTERIFAKFSYNSYTSVSIQRWAKKAGIKKDGLTFHSARHTFAVMMLELGADLFTVSKLLGHREIKTTQVYAHVLDKTKQAAALLIPDITTKSNG